MRKIVWTIAILAGFMWMAAVAFFVSIDIQTLDPEEQQKLKEGKNFWEWRSAYGALSMHYVEKGEGNKHLLLLHGFRAHSYTWKFLLDPLAKADYHVWAIDLIGYGLSDKPEQAVYSIDFFVQQVNAFMEAKGITKAHLIGNSMGGGLALSLALNHPQRIDSLTLLSALGYPLDLPLHLSFSKHFSQIWIPLLSPIMIRQGLKQVVFNKDKITEEQVEAYRLPYRFPGGIVASLLTLQKFDNHCLVEMAEHYPSLNCPTLIIWGARDTLIPISHYEKFIKDFPHAHKLLIPNCGHIPQEEAPEQVLTALLTFLRTIDSSSYSVQETVH